MTEMTERIELVCHAREYDLPDSEHYPLYLMWLESVSRWGVESPPARGCLLELVRAAWGSERILVSIYDGGHALVSIGVTAFEVDGSSLGQSLVECLEAA